MYYSALDLLACPKCGHHPLKLYVIEEENVPPPEEIKDRPLCIKYCGFKRVEVDRLTEPPCRECLSRKVKAGILVCPACGMWYPISRGIPVMLVEEKLRKKPVSLFLERYRDRIPVELKDVIGM